MQPKVQAEWTHPTSRPLRPLRGKPGVFPVIDVDSLFALIPALLENRAGLCQELFTIVETTLKAQRVSIILSLEDSMLTKGSPFLTVSLLLTPSEDGNALAYMASANYTEIAFHVGTQKCFPAVLWDSRSFGIADPAKAYEELPLRVMELALQFAEDIPPRR